MAQIQTHARASKCSASGKHRRLSACVTQRIESRVKSCHLSSVLEASSSCTMKLKELQSLLQDVADFQKPKQKLEQYLTGPHLASVIVHEIADRHEDLPTSTVIDLGCGTGMLGIACSLKGCPHVLGIDIDDDALQQAAQNIDEFEELPMQLLAADVCSCLPFHRLPIADLVICNPPFGSWRKGADTEFLAAAAQLAHSAIYSLHKRSTRQHIRRFCLETLAAASADVIGELRYDLPATYKHHRQASKDIEVDLWKVELPPRQPV